MTTLFYVAAHALIEKDGCFLVTRRSELTDYMPLKWDVPGGTVDPGETLEQTVIREIFEETQIEISIGKLLHVYTNLSQLPQRQTCQAIFLCKYISGEIILNPEEHDKYMWIPKEDFAGLDAIAFLRDLIESQSF